jgi:hypothetical protein
VKFSELTQLALLGTERQALAAAVGDSDVDRLLAQIDLNRREEALLSTAAVVGLHEEVGQLPARDQAPAPEPCATEEMLRMSERAGSLGLRLLGGDFPELLPEFLKLSARAAQIALPEALPALLSTGMAKAEWREAILPVLGKRGRWLAVQNPEWAWAIAAADDDENIWQVGEGEARRLFLQRLRRTNPVRARELLTATWKEETPEDRGDFIRAFEIGLSAEDEPFLEAALDDKRKEVRRHAATLLAQIDGSGLVKRMTERLRPLLKFVPGESGNLFKLRKSKPASLEVILPNACDRSMQRDGIEPKPQPGFGEKFWWLIQMLEAVPLTLWTTEWSASPGEIVQASLAGEWKNEFFEAWARAAIRQKNAAWAEVLFAVSLAAKRMDKFEGLLAALPVTERERRLSSVLEGDDPKIRDLHGSLVAQCRHDWSPEFSRTILSWLRKLAGQQSTDWQLRNQIKDFAARLTASVLSEASTGWPATDSPGWDFWSKGMDEFLAVAQFRSEMHAAFPK